MFVLTFNCVLKVQFIAKVFNFVKGKIYFVALHKRTKQFK